VVAANRRSSPPAAAAGETLGFPAVTWAETGATPGARAWHRRQSPAQSSLPQTQPSEAHPTLLSREATGTMECPPIKDASQHARSLSGWHLDTKGGRAWTS